MEPPGTFDLVRICSVDRCAGGVRVGGKCGAHYTAARRRRMPKCSEANCRSKAHARGLCEAHYTRRRLTGTLAPYVAHRCEKEGCLRRPRTKAEPLCEFHRRRANPDFIAPEEVNRLKGLGLKLCSRCRMTKPLAEFYAATAKRASRCKGCVAAANRERIFGLPSFAFEKMLVAQDNRCAICAVVFGKTMRTQAVVDHSHLTGEVRGLLCQSCNFGIGVFDENGRRLRAAASYLMSFRPAVEAIVPASYHERRLRRGRG